ncbi:MAG: phytanoyl-CoA dioxygenase family protein [Cyanobacteria bacterium J06592_8]
MQSTLLTHISDLEKRGFIHIPSFLNHKELELLCKDFENAEVMDTDNYAIKRVSSETFQQISEKLESIVKIIQENAIANVDLFDGPGMYFPNWKEEATATNPEPSRQQFPWHQDHESYFWLQDHSNYFNFYIPMIKPVPEKSNLTIIPNDKLKERVPEIYEQLSGRGAVRVVKDGEQDVILDDDCGGIIARLDFDIADLEETPQLQAGDLLLLKGDVLHKTQDASTQRVAVSFRLLNSQSTVQRAKLVNGGLVKTVMMFNSWKSYELELRYFNLIQSEAATFDEIQKFVDSNTVSSKFGQLYFLLKLFGEKLLNGNIFRILLDLRLLNLLLPKN